MKETQLDRSIQSIKNEISDCETIILLAQGLIDKYIPAFNETPEQVEASKQAKRDLIAKSRARIDELTAQAEERR